MTVDSDAPCVLVKSDLRPSTYKALAAVAKEHRVEVGVVLSILADRAVRRPKRAPIAADVDEKIRALNGRGLSDNRIAKQLGLAQSTVSRRRREMGLESPTPRHGGRRAAA